MLDLGTKSSATLTLTLLLTQSLTFTSLSSCTPEPPSSTGVDQANQTKSQRAPLRSTTSPDQSPTQTNISSDPAAELFHKRCSRCHGARGDGRGAFASQLNPPPTDLTSALWYQQTDEKKIKRVILGGGRAIGKSPMMPSHADLRNKPKLLNALVRHVVNLAPRNTAPSPAPKSP